MDISELEALFTEVCGLKRDAQLPVLLGLSGGPDSMCLCELLIKAGFTVTAAHFDHGLRSTSGAEAEMVGVYARSRGVAFVLGCEDVRGYAEAYHLSIEEAARHLRYKFLFREARRAGAQALAVAHNADDQVETILMHLLRGSGLGGLRGMPFRTCLSEFDPQIPVVRPLLNTWRSEILAYCDESALTPIFDESNQDTRYYRNRLRNKLIPELETYNPQVKAALWRLGRTVEGDLEIIEQAVDDAWDSCCKLVSSDFSVLDFDQFRRQRFGVQRALIRRAMALFQPALRDVSFDVVERALFAIQETRLTGRVDLSANLVMAVESGEILIGRKGFTRKDEAWPQFSLDRPRQLNVSGDTDLGGGWVISAEIMDYDGFQMGWIDNVDPYQAWLDADLAPSALQLRTRQAGDRFDPLGMDGHSMKLSDFFINEKLAQSARDQWPLVTSADQIVWVAGMRSAHFCRTTPRTRRVLHLHLMRRTE